MLTLTRLEIRRFRNIAPTTLHFGPGFNVLLGKNGTRKTTLLDLIAAILSDDLSRYAHEEIDLTYELSSNYSLTVEMSRTRVEVPPPAAEATIPSRLETGPRFDEIGVLEIRERRERIEVRGRQTSINGPVQLPVGPFERAFRLSTTSMARLDFLEGHSTAGELQRFDESLGMFMAMTGEGSSPIAMNVVFDGAGPFGSGRLSTASLWLVLFHHLSRAFDEDAVRATSDELHFLGAAAKAFDMSRAEARFPVDRRESPSAVEFILGPPEFRFIRAGNAIRHGSLSYGQKRLLSFFYYLELTAGAPVVADELVNGLHHEWIDLCVSRLRDRQCFLTSQNPLLLDYLSFDSVEAVERSFILCHLQREEELERVEVRNMTRAEAEGFYSAYQARIQHVGEILRDRGLW